MSMFKDTNEAIQWAHDTVERGHADAPRFSPEATAEFTADLMAGLTACGATAAQAGAVTDQVSGACNNLYTRLSAVVVAAQDFSTAMEVLRRAAANAQEKRRPTTFNVDG